ncbi:MAG: hypothetical protein RL227_1408 [Pseudomonadota bacterium]|jgi:very-short-patch-repair endonuclease
MTPPAEVLKRESAAARRNALAETMALQLRAAGLAPVREFRFHPVRKWRFDFCFPEQKLALEVDGGTFTGGRHTRGTGYAEDCRKIAEAMLLGWRVLRASADQVKTGEALRWVEALAQQETAS